MEEEEGGGGAAAAAAAEGEVKEAEEVEEEEEVDEAATSAPCSRSASRKAAAPTAWGLCVRQSLVRSESVRRFQTVWARTLAPGPARGKGGVVGALAAAAGAAGWW